MSYINELLKKDCFPQLHPLFVKSNNPEKEISESMAALKHLSSFVKIIDETMNFHIGDGRYCRTAALFTFLTKSWNTSIDPIINVARVTVWENEEKVNDHFDIFAGKFQDYEWEDREKPCNLVCVHSHIVLKDLIKHFPHWRYLYTNPCCNPRQQIFDIQTLKQNNISVLLAGADNKILSEKNEVYLYRNNNEVK
ncbi:MAG: hypothetical protein PHX80_04100 [Candidatus Nanoarchaeia archaeon]|nr:hypothetical protein [Candidatus Nanoarchaeia archaeon]